LFNSFGGGGGGGGDRGLISCANSGVSLLLQKGRRSLFQSQLCCLSAARGGILIAQSVSQSCMRKGSRSSSIKREGEREREREREIKRERERRRGERKREREREGGRESDCADRHKCSNYSYSHHRAVMSTALTARAAAVYIHITQGQSWADT
jgi:hypothetical protein